MAPDASEGDNERVLKLLMLGDSTVEKQRLVNLYCEGGSEPESLLPTIGVSFNSKRLECSGRKIKLQIWDTAGQDRFRCLAPAFFRAAMGVVLCYDLTDAESFRNIEHWLKQLMRDGDFSVRKILLATNCDREGERQVPREDGEVLAAMFGMPFAEVSSATGVGVDAAFRGLAEVIVGSAEPAEPASRSSRKVFSFGRSKAQTTTALAVPQKLARQVSLEDGKALAAKWGMALFEASAGVDGTALCLAQLMVLSGQAPQTSHAKTSGALAAAAAAAKRLSFGLVLPGPLRRTAPKKGEELAGRLPRELRV